MTLTRIGEFAIDRVVELEFPAFIAREFFPACTEAQLADGKARLGNLISADDKLRIDAELRAAPAPKHSPQLQTRLERIQQAARMNQVLLVHARSCVQGMLQLLTGQAAPSVSRTGTVPQPPPVAINFRG